MRIIKSRLPVFQFGDTHTRTHYKSSSNNISRGQSANTICRHYLGKKPLASGQYMKINSANCKESAAAKLRFTLLPNNLQRHRSDLHPNQPLPLPGNISGQFNKLKTRYTILLISFPALQFSLFVSCFSEARQSPLCDLIRPADTLLGLFGSSVL